MQKWYTVYEEAMRVPLMLACAGEKYKWLDEMPAVIDTPSCSVDLLPTLLALASIDQDEVLQCLERTHTHAPRHLPGRDWSASREHVDSSALLMVEDDIFRGESQYNMVANVVPWLYPFRWLMAYETVRGPTAIHCLVFLLCDDISGESELWKYAEYYDNDTQGNAARGAQGRALEYELYNLKRDPLEVRNLLHTTTGNPRECMNVDAESIRRARETGAERLREAIGALHAAGGGTLPAHRPAVISSKPWSVLLDEFNWQVNIALLGVVMASLVALIVLVLVLNGVLRHLILAVV